MTSALALDGEGVSQKRLYIVWGIEDLADVL